MLEAARRSGATIIGHQFHQFTPHGVSGVVLIAESHLSIHTWPERGYAAVDIFTCGTTMRPEVAIAVLVAAFSCRDCHTTELSRGYVASGQGVDEPPRERIPTVLYATGGVFEVEITRRLAERRSVYQQILVVDTVDYGRCLLIDGVMQTSSLDHQIYDDAILARLRPTDRAVLIVGGGDGYVALRALERAPELRLTVVDIDPAVVELSEAFLNPGFTTHPRVRLHVGDGVEFAQSLAPSSFDGVALDLTDIPLDASASGDAERLYDAMIRAVLPRIRPGGWLSVQGGPSVVPPGTLDLSRVVASLLHDRVQGLVREDAFLPSYGEKNAFFHGQVGERDPPDPARTHPPPPEGIGWQDATVGVGLATALALTLVYEEPGAQVFDHPRLGRALVVEGALQDIDEDPGWREMLAHVPLLGGPEIPRSILLIGGGDGLVLREVLRHPFVERVTLWGASSPALAGWLGTEAALADPRVRRVDEVDEGCFDVIFVLRPSLRQPGDAAAVGARLGALLAPGGVVADADAVVLGRSGPRWYREAPGYGPTVRAASGLRRVGRYFATGAVVPGGFWGFDLLGHQAQDRSTPRADFTGRHYNAELHAAAFALPRFFRELP